MSVKSHTLKTDKVKPSQIIKKMHYSIFIKITCAQSILLYMNFFFIRGVEDTFFWNHIIITNRNLALINLFLILINLFNLLSNTLCSNNINYNNDFFFAIANVSIYLIILYYTNTIFSFIFLLEVISITIFYKFIMSKLWFKSSITEDKINFSSNLQELPKNYLNMLFFQYWSTFFSSFLLIYSFINIHLYYGLSDYFNLNFLELVNQITFLSITNTSLIIWLPFFIAIFFKIGLTPFHLFKVEIYKGLPIVSLLFYTTFYFLIYLLFISIIYIAYIESLKIVLNSIFIILLLFGSLYIACLLFDLTSMKSFFAYSTIINTVLFFSLLLST